MYQIEGGYFYTASGQDVEKGTLLIENGKIKVITPGKVSADSKTERIDAAGRFITPGLVDVHTHLGLCEEGVGEELCDVNETTGPANPHLRAVDAINPADSAFKDARAAGVTTVQVLPGSANVFGGEAAILKTDGTTVDAMALKINSGLKVAFGENPRKAYGKEQKKVPGTRMAIAAILREELTNAANYLSERENGTSTRRDLKLEALARLLQGEVVMRAHAHRADDIATALRISSEFNLKISIEHCTEGQKLAELLAERKVPVAVGPNLSAKSKVELRELSWHNIVNLAAAGVPLSIITDHPVVPINYLNVCAALAVREGLSEEEALAGITINAARHLEMDNRIGSLEPGKDADLVIWSGHPLDYRSKVEKTFIDGRIVYEDD